MYFIICKDILWIEAADMAYISLLHKVQCSIYKNYQLLILTDMLKVTHYIW